MFRVGCIESQSVLFQGLRASKAYARPRLMRVQGLCASKAYARPRLTRIQGLRAVIRMARQNGRGPIDLFQKHDANHLMRPGRGTERKAQLSLAPQIGRKAVRAADDANRVGD